MPATAIYVSFCVIFMVFFLFSLLTTTAVGKMVMPQKYPGCLSNVIFAVLAEYC